MGGGWITGHRRMSDSEAVIQTQMFGRVVRRQLVGTFSAPAVTQPWHREAAGRRRSSPARRTVQCIMTKKSMLWCHMHVCCRGRGFVSQWGTCPRSQYGAVLQEASLLGMMIYLHADYEQRWINRPGSRVRARDDDAQQSKWPTGSELSIWGEVKGHKRRIGKPQKEVVFSTNCNPANATDVSGEFVSLAQRKKQTKKTKNESVKRGHNILSINHSSRFCARVSQGRAHGCRPLLLPRPLPGDAAAAAATIAWHSYMPTPRPPAI